MITINVAEADDAERERRRVQMHEPYRTLLGHFRHEIGHYYWDRLIRDSDRIDGFRQLFGDERQDYGRGPPAAPRSRAPPADWADSFVSAYASAHPWEDWAEIVGPLPAHDRHPGDGRRLRPLAPAAGGRASPNCGPCPTRVDVDHRTLSFDQMVERWFPLTYVLNNLNRGMGLQDAYPFVLLHAGGREAAVRSRDGRWDESVR